MWASSGFLFAAHEVFLGDSPETDSAIRFRTCDPRSLLLHRLEAADARKGSREPI